MKPIWIVALLGIAGFAWWQYKKSPAAKHQEELAGSAGSQPTGAYEPAGVPTFNDSPAPQDPRQLHAFAKTNPDQVTEDGFSPAFGAMENQPAAHQEIPLY